MAGKTDMAGGSPLDFEGTVAVRYRWWGVYLLREKRRLQAIADAVALSEAAAARAEEPQRPVLSEPEPLTLSPGNQEEDPALIGTEVAWLDDEEALAARLRGRAALLGAADDGVEES
jgi:hypothetical protein